MKIIHSSVDGYFSCLHFVGIMKSIHVHIFVSIYIFNTLGYILRGQMAGSYCDSVNCFPQWLLRHLHSYQQCTRAPNCPHLLQYLLFSFKNYNFILIMLFFKQLTKFFTTDQSTLSGWSEPALAPHCVTAYPIIFPVVSSTSFC